MPVSRRRRRAISVAAAVCVAALGLLGASGVVQEGGASPLLAVGLRVAPTATGVEVSFLTARPSRTTVELGTDDTYGLRVSETNGPAYLHRFSIRGLRPETEYRFRLAGARGLLASPGSFRTSRVGASASAATAGRVVTLDGDPFLPTMTWAQCADDVEANLALGVDVFMGYSSCTADAEDELLRAVGSRALTLLPAGGQPGSLGWHQMDEPDGYGVPPSSLPDLPSRAAPGKVTFLTVTAHFGPSDGSLQLGKDVYPDYFARADVVGFDYYTFGKGCDAPYTGLSRVYDEQRVLMQLTSKPTFQWIETGPLEGDCLKPGAPQLTPERLRAEVWLAMTAGATGLGYFTHTWNTGAWLRFDVRPEIAAEIVRQNGRIAALQPALLAPLVAVHAEPSAAIKASARLYGGSLYVLAVNATEQTQSATLRVAGLRQGTRLAVWQEHRSLVVRRRGVVEDTFGPLEVHVYRAG